MRSLRLGVIGMSEGNGHPYSWAAIFNGYDPDEMTSCPFPAIPRYLSERSFPRDAIREATVTHVWSQDRDVSKHIASASLVPNVVERPGDMLDSIDALLLARDDAKLHLQYAAPFLEAGLPVYIDKPLALSLHEAEALIARQAQPGLIFSCSALSYAPELRLTHEEAARIGPVTQVRGCTQKGWATYAPHVIEPALRLLGVGTAPPDRLKAHTKDGSTQLEAVWPGGLSVDLTTLGVESSSPIKFEVMGEGGSHTLAFRDSFTAFKSALQRFVRIVKGEQPPMSRDELLAPVRLVEAGLRI